MKRFKDLLNEFRGSIENNDNHNNGGGDWGDIHRGIKEFMKKNSFHYKTPEGHELHFHDSLNAAHVVAEGTGMHYAGWHHSIPFEGHSKSTEDGRRRALMTNYFVKSTETHDNIMDALEDHIKNHPDLPQHYRDHVATVIGDIEEEHTIHDPSKIDKVGKYMMHHHRPPVNATMRHPHLADSAHHLKDVRELLDAEPDQGYFLRKEEQI